MGPYSREITRTKDITGGLPRVAELFEARKPKEPSIMSKSNGTVSFGDDVKGKRQLIITDDDGEEEVYAVPKGKHVFVTDGDYVRKGEIVSDGGVNPHDILKIKGEIELARYLVDEIQEVYRLQGVRINDKHIEVIVRQMLRRSKVNDPGDSRFLEGEQRGGLNCRKPTPNLRRRAATGSHRTVYCLVSLRHRYTSFYFPGHVQETTRILPMPALTPKRLAAWLERKRIMGSLSRGTGQEFYKGITSQVRPQTHRNTGKAACKKPEAATREELF